MQNLQTSARWSLRFKRQLVSWSIIAATPVVQLVARFSNIPKPMMFKVSIASFVLVLLGCAYVFKNLTSKAEAPTSRRESWVLGIVFSIVLALLFVNAYFLFSNTSSAATTLR